MADFIGTTAGNRLTGGAEDDYFEGLAGDDVLKGGGGTDTARFFGNLTDYDWTTTSKGWEITGPDGTDSLESIEILQFDDFSWNLTGDNAPVFNYDALIFTTDVNTPFDFDISGYDIDAPGFIAYTTPYIQSLTRTFYEEYDIGLGQGVNASYTYDPRQRGEYLNQPLALGETFTVNFSYRYGSAQDGYTNIPVQIIVSGVNDAPEVLRTDYTNLTTFVVEDAGVAAFDLQTFADDVDSDDTSASLNWEVVNAPATLNVWFDGQTLYVDPGANYQLLSDGQWVEETIVVRAVDQHGAKSEPLSYTVRVFGADDPQPDYQNEDGSPNYAAIGTNPSASPDLGVISGLINDPDNLTYTQHTAGDDVLVLRGDAMGYFENGSFLYEQNNLPWTDLSINMGAGNDKAIIKLDNQIVEVQNIEMDMGEGENLIVLDFDSSENVVFQGNDFKGGQHSSQIIVDIDSNGSVYFVGNDFAFGDGNDRLHVMITATGQVNAFPFQSVLNFNNKYSLGGGKDTIILDFDVTDGGDMEFINTIFAGAGDDYIRIDNLDSVITTEFPSDGKMGFTGRIDAGQGDDVVDFFWQANTGEFARGTIAGGMGTDTLNLWGDEADWTLVEHSASSWTLTNGGQTIDVFDFEALNFVGNTPTGGGPDDPDPNTGTADDDLLTGTADPDKLKGNGGNDMLRGQEGADLLFGGEGHDRLVGDAGADRFVFAENAGFDIVYDFADGIDQIALLDLQFADITISAHRSTDTLISFGDAHMILRDVDAGAIDISDFVTITESDLL